MDKAHWERLFDADWFAIYLLPKFRILEVINDYAKLVKSVKKQSNPFAIFTVPLFARGHSYSARISYKGIEFTISNKVNEYSLIAQALCGIQPLSGKLTKRFREQDFGCGRNVKENREILKMYSTKKHTAKIIIDSLNDRALELLMDPSFDLKVDTK